MATSSKRAARKGHSSKKAVPLKGCAGCREKRYFQGARRSLLTEADVYLRGAPNAQALGIVRGGTDPVKVLGKGKMDYILVKARLGTDGKTRHLTGWIPRKQVFGDKPRDPSKPYAIKLANGTTKKISQKCYACVPKVTKGKHAGEGVFIRFVTFRVAAPPPPGTYRFKGNKNPFKTGEDGTWIGVAMKPTARPAWITGRKVNQIGPWDNTNERRGGDKRTRLYRPLKSRGEWYWTQVSQLGYIKDLPAEYLPQICWCGSMYNRALFTSPKTVKKPDGTRVPVNPSNIPFDPGAPAKGKKGPILIIKHFQCRALSNLQRYYYLSCLETPDRKGETLNLRYRITTARRPGSGDLEIVVTLHDGRGRGVRVRYPGEIQAYDYKAHEKLPEGTPAGKRKQVERENKDFAERDGDKGVKRFRISISTGRPEAAAWEHFGGGKREPTLLEHLMKINTPPR